MTLRDQRAFAICLGGCDPGAQSCCPRSVWGAKSQPACLTWGISVLVVGA